ncbi:hypothetical protein [Natronococcus occultus]|uniref:Uncharacterized protein n=1 Tax=Natronococcus occultus SP4 TaxID=694430 RepID=L0JU69_9EURY|nr:hypothetical protein [Natronococcus occultus]AGB36281.1 hypothetical protein Natoc_0416 [Natronococcus occultus SP4]
MNATRSVALLAAVLVVGLAVAPATSGTPASVGDGPAVEQHEDGHTTHDADVERGVTTFMQSSAADTASTVESALFEAKYEDADDETRERLVDEQIDSLATQLDVLENERDRLREDGDELSTPQYQARMTELTVEIVAMERAIDRTKPLAADNGIGTDRLESIETDLTELGGEQIAAVATELVGFEQAPGGEPVAEDGADGNVDPKPAPDDTEDTVDKESSATSPESSDDAAADE